MWVKKNRRNPLKRQAFTRCHPFRALAFLTGGNVKNSLLRCSSRQPLRFPAWLSNLAQNARDSCGTTPPDISGFLEEMPVSHYGYHP